MDDYLDDSWILSNDLLENTPSIREDGYSLLTERQYRNKSIIFLDELVKELKCDRYVLATACVLLHRFYVFQSFVKHNRFIVSAACLFLASKVEDSYRPVKDIVSTFIRVRGKFGYKDELEYNSLLEKILLTERIVLSTLAFDVRVIHPFKSFMQKIKEVGKNIVDKEEKTTLYQLAVAFMNDSYRTTLCLRYQSHHIATVALFMAILKVGALPISKTSLAGRSIEQMWFQILNPGIDELQVQEICHEILDVYSEKFAFNSFDLQSINALQARIINFSSGSNNIDHQIPAPYSLQSHSELPSSSFAIATDSLNFGLLSYKSSIFAIPSVPSISSNVTKMVSMDNIHTIGNVNRGKELTQPLYNASDSPYSSAASDNMSSPPAPPPSETPGYYSIAGSSIRESPPPIPPNETPASIPQFYENYERFHDDSQPPPPPPSDTPLYCSRPPSPPLSSPPIKRHKIEV